MKPVKRFPERVLGSMAVASAAVVLALLVAGSAHAQTADNVLLLVNENSPASLDIGNYYAQKRSIPPSNIVRLKAATTDTTERLEYLRTIEAPLAAFLASRRLQDQILYIVLTKGFPLRIAGTGDRDGTLASVDSELTLLYRKMVGETVPQLGRVDNPYFLGGRPMAEAKPFVRTGWDIYLVTRLDGFTVSDVHGLIDRALAPSREGIVVLDDKATYLDRGGDRWLSEATERLRRGSHEDRVLHETTRTVAATTQPVLGYYSWGSNDPANQQRHFGMNFVAGAIGGMFVSTDGRTFNEPPADWRPSEPTGGRLFNGSFQSLAGDLIRDGITGVAAHVAEPLLDATIRPQILFPAYFAAMNLAESFYLAMPFLSWRTVIVGDPLCSPFPRAPLRPDDLTQGIDDATELPAVFAGRRLATSTREGLNPIAVSLLLKVESREARNSRSEYEALLTRATEMEPKLNAAHMRLAILYTERNDYVKAVDRYRRIIATDPQHVVALNNLAYALAEYQHAPKEALPFAQRAYRVSPTPMVLDTLAWVHHLVGDDAAALPFIDSALPNNADNVDILLHAAVIHAATGDAERAGKELDAAEKLDRKVSDRAEIKELRRQLAAASTSR
jgi:uncharacterized protein (TIGR03790 family)